MAVANNEQQVTWSSSDSVSVSAGGTQTSDAVTFSTTAFAAMITFKADNSGTPAAGDTVDFNIRLTERGLETGAVPCTVVWAGDDEIEVRFPGSPGFTVGEMQTILDN